VKRILVIDDEVEAFRDVLGEVLDGYLVSYAASGKEGLAKLSDDIGLILLDINMPATVGSDPDREGLAVMAEIARRRPGLPVVMFTSYGEVGLALEAGRLGALDYLIKMQDLDRLPGVVEKALALEPAPAGPVTQRTSFGRLIGASPRMQKLYGEIERVAKTSLPVLLLGPTGSGKDAVARTIHEASPRAEKVFRAINVSAVPKELFESVLFGHAKGSFTGATQDKEGEFEASSGGTLFLDEIGTLSHEVQVKLLRVLEEKSVTRVGETRPRPVDARVIAATNANLLKEVHEGRFREDLYYRLRVATILVPPLGERKEDIPLLAEHFLKQTTAEEGLPPRTLSREAVDALCGHSWPGNVRELLNVVKSAAVFAQGVEIGPDDLDLEAAAGVVTVHHDLDGLFEDQKRGNTGVATPRDFKTKFGEEALRHVLERAVEETHDQAQAGVVLGFLRPEHTPAEYNTFRQWFRRVGLTSRDILR
jgi:DNA-binding NtrC family response regulator